MKLTVKALRKVFNDQIEKCDNILNVRAAKYTRTGNRLHNFVRMQELRRHNSLVTPVVDALQKHLVWFLDVADDFEDDDARTLPTEEALDEMFTDLINYLILAKAAMLEEIE